MVKFSGPDQASREWRRSQAEISNDISGAARSTHYDAFAAVMQTLDISDAERIAAMTEYFRHLGDRGKSLEW